jgi:hypothetical protein
LRDRFANDTALEGYLRPFWIAWDSRRRPDGKPYSKTKPAWLTEWAINGQIPPPSRSSDTSQAAKPETVFDRARRRLANNGD